MAQLASPGAFMTSTAGLELAGRGGGNPKSLPSKKQPAPTPQSSKTLKTTDSQGDDEIDFFQALSLPREQLFSALTPARTNNARSTPHYLLPLTAPSTDPTRQKAKTGEDVTKRITLREALEQERQGGSSSNPASPSTGSNRKLGSAPINRVASPVPKPDPSAPPSLTAQLLSGGRIRSYSIDGWEDPENLKRITLSQALQDDPAHISIHRALKEPLASKASEIDLDDPEYRKTLTLQEALNDDPTHISILQALNELSSPGQSTSGLASPGRSPIIAKSPIPGQGNGLVRRNTDSTSQPAGRRSSAQLARAPRRASTNDKDRGGWTPPSDSGVSPGRPGHLPAAQTLPSKLPSPQQKKGDNQFQYMEMWNALQRELTVKPPSTVWRKAARMTFEIIDDEEQLHEFSGKNLVVWLLRYLRSCDYFVTRNIEITYEKAKMLSATLLDRRAIRPVRGPLEQPFSVSGSYCVMQHYNEWMAKKRDKYSAAKSLSQTGAPVATVQAASAPKQEPVPTAGRTERDKVEGVTGPTWVEAQRAKDKNKASKIAPAPGPTKGSLSAVKLQQQPPTSRSPSSTFSLPTSSLPPNFAKYTNVDRSLDDLSLCAPTNVGFFTGSMDSFPTARSTTDDDFGPAPAEIKEDLFSARRRHAKKWSQVHRGRPSLGKDENTAEVGGEKPSNEEGDGENGPADSNSGTALECVSADTSFVDMESSIEGDGAKYEDSIISLTASEMDMSQEAEQRKMDEIEAEIAEEVKREEEEEKANALEHVQANRRGSVASLPESLDEVPGRRFSYGQGAVGVTRLQRKMAVADIEEIVGVFEFLSDKTPHELEQTDSRPGRAADPLDDSPSTPTSIMSGDLAPSEPPTPTQTPAPERDTREVAKIEEEAVIEEVAKIEVVKVEDEVKFEENASIEEKTNEVLEDNEVEDFHSDDWKAVDDLLSSLTSDLLEVSNV